MVTSQNLYEGIKRPTINNNKSPRKVMKITKKVVPKKTSFIPKS